MPSRVSHVQLDIVVLIRACYQSNAKLVTIVKQQPQVVHHVNQVIHVLLEALHQMPLIIYALWASTALMEVLLM